MELNQEKGYALLLALLLIAVFSILALTLVSTNSNRMVQIQHSEEKIVARNMAEIGMKNAEEVLKKAIKEKKYEEPGALQEILQQRIHQNMPYTMDNVSSFIYEIQNFTVTEEMLTMTLLATGMHKKRTEEIQAEFTVKRHKGEQLFPLPTSTDTLIKGEDINTRRNETWHGNHYIDGVFSLSSNSTVKVYGNLVVSSLLKQAANTNLLVYENSYIYESDVKENGPNVGNLGFFCTEKTLFYYGSPVELFTIPKNKTCNGLNNQKPPLNGIYAREVVWMGKEDDNTSYWDEGSFTITSVYH